MLSEELKMNEWGNVGQLDGVLKTQLDKGIDDMEAKRELLLENAFHEVDIFRKHKVEY